MARNTFDDQGGQAGTAEEGHITVFQAEGKSSVMLPEGNFLAEGDMTRQGQDLILHNSEGHEVVIEGYFSGLESPTLITAQGSQLTPSLVQSFVKSDGPLEYAANESATDESAVGLVKEVSGEATVIRTDGTSEKISIGTEIYQGDVVETAVDGAVNIIFLDESSFAVSNNARLSIDEYVFDPATQGGETNVSILRGMFVFTSGLIGRDDPDDVQIDTPVGSIGIRGTTIAGHINPDGESQITVVEGAIVIKNGLTEVTLADQYDTVTLTGFNSQIEMKGILSSDQMRTSYGDIGDVNPGFFNTLNETQGTIEGTIEGTVSPAPVQDSAPDDAQESPLTTDVPVPLNETRLQESAPAQTTAEYDIFNDPLKTGFEDSIRQASDNPYDTTETTRNIVGGTLLASTGITTGTTTTPIKPLATDTRAASTAEPPPLPPLELVLEVFVDDDALAGETVGRAYTTIAYESANISFINVPTNGGGDRLFALVKEGPGVYKIVLTSAGETELAGYALGDLIGNIRVGVTLADGRTDSASITAIYDDYNTPAATGPSSSLDLDTVNPATHSFMAGSATMGLGYGAAYLGDFDRNGTNNFGVTTQIAASGVVNLPSHGYNLSIAGDTTALSIAGGGDVNGDGYVDFIVGRPDYDASGNEGQINIHSGANPMSSTLTIGGSPGDSLGHKVAIVDFNGDGYADVFASALQYAGNQGALFWYEGTNTVPFGSGVSFSLLTDGAANDFLGQSMAALSDYNNDGFGDIALGSVGAAAYVNIYYGAATANGTADVVISGISNSAGNLKLYGLGDIDGDGRSDLLIDNSIQTNQLFIFNGGNSGGNTSAADIRITSASDIVGSGNAGDFNGDGYDDIFVATRNGDQIDAFVVYGSPTLGGTITLDPNWVTNNPGHGYHLTFDLNNYGLPSSLYISGISVGDNNNDGFEDLLITSAQLNGDDGGYFLVYGTPDPSHLLGPDPEIHTDVGAHANAPSSMVASSNNDGLVGSGANNIMSNQNGGNTYQSISFQAGAGDDLIRLYGNGANMARVLDGGQGSNDRLAWMDTGTLDLRNVSEFSGIERIVMAGTGTQNMTIGLNDIFELMETSQNNTYNSRYTLFIGEDGSGTKTLTIDDPANAVTLTAAGFTANGTQNDGGQTYNVYSFGSGYQLMIDADIAVTIN